MPSITCPCCRAANTAGPNCRRCSADLSLLFKLEADREALLAAASTHLAAGRTGDALPLIAHAETLRPGPDSLRLRAVASLLNRDFAAAFEFYKTARG